jgi:peptidoglycan/LPS O-acetylase OafA/YrhL
MGADAARPDDDDPGGAIAHIPALDGTRGLAILLVLLVHFGVGAGFAGRVSAPWGSALERAFYVGWSGVDLFFVLSGFLITSILLASKAQPRYFGRFYGRRALRIFPLYYVGLVLGLLVVPAVWPGEVNKLLGESLRGQAWFWTYTLNVGYALGWLSGVGVLGQFWTLTIEEQFYLAWPAIVKVSTERALVAVCIVMAVGALCLRVLWLSQGWPGGWQGAYRFTLTRVDALAIGAVVAVLVRDPAWRARLDRWTPAGLALGLAAVGALAVTVRPFYPNSPVVVTFGHTLLALTFGWLIVLASGSRSPRWLRMRGLRVLGKFSYGIYVWHWPLQQVMLLYHAERFLPVTFLATGLLGSFALGWLSYVLIERPFLKLKRVFAYERRTTAGAAAAVA